MHTSVRYHLWFASAIAVAGAAWLAQIAAAETQRPNIVVILADDLGYGDVRCYNPDRGKIPTPNIDRLAAQGMRFTDAHSSSGVCSPSRYTLLTGRYHWRTRLQSGIVGVFGEPLIAPDRLTIAGLAKQHGYRTACIGKWHLGWDWPIPKEQRPLFQIGKGPDDEASPSEAHLAAWREVFSQPIPAARPRAASTNISARTCPTGRPIASSKTTAPSASRACSCLGRCCRTISPACRGRP